MATAAVVATACVSSCTGMIETGPPVAPAVGTEDTPDGSTAVPAERRPDAGPPTPTPPTPTVNAGPAAHLRRLTRPQLENTLRDLLGGAVTLTETEPDTWIDGLASIGAQATSISPSGVEQHEAAIGRALDEVFSNATRRAALYRCTPAGTADAACMRTFVSSFGRRAWRGALPEEAIARYTSLGVTVATDLADFHTGARHAAWAMLQAPQFLYRVELATVPDPRDRTRRRFSSAAMASRLSFFLWNTTPDDELLAAAERDELAAVPGITAQAERLLRSTRAEQMAGNLARELFQLHRLETLPKDTQRFPQMTSALRTAMATEVTRLFQRVFTGDRDATELFDTLDTSVSADLAKLYGLPAGLATGTTLVPATWPAEGTRAGVLGTAAVLALNAKQNATSPTVRGRMIRESFLCQTVPDPPPGVDAVLEAPPPGVMLTTRENLQRHQREPACAGCHALLDPLGLPLETFDAIGAFRTTDAGKTIDTSGTLDGKPFANARELGQRLRASSEARRCLVRTLYRYASGHHETAAHEGLIDELDGAFVKGGRRMRALALAIVTSEAFRHASTP